MSHSWSTQKSHLVCPMLHKHCLCVQRKCSHIPVSYSLLLVDGQFNLRWPRGAAGKFRFLEGESEKDVNFKSDANVRQLLTEMEDKWFHHLHGKWEEVDQVQLCISIESICKCEFSDYNSRPRIIIRRRKFLFWFC